MKKIYLYGNWKMNMTCAETTHFFQTLGYTFVEDKLISSALGRELEIAVFPPFTSLMAARIAKQVSVYYGAQNIYFEPKGAFTGEVSIPMLKELECTHVIVGHSERRAIFKEDNSMLAKKVKAVLDAGLTPVFCFGETLAEREAGKTLEVVTAQLTAGIENLTANEISKIVFAYEPVWAIGTGKSATSAEAQEVCAESRKLIIKLSGKEIATVVLYGGSVKPENSRELLSMPDIDGALVGGASLKVESFLNIFKAYKED